MFVFRSHAAASLLTPPFVSLPRCRSATVTLILQTPTTVTPSKKKKKAHQMFLSIFRCSLGDVTNSDSCYEKAQEVFGNKSARALVSAKFWTCSLATISLPTYIFESSDMDRLGIILLVCIQDSWQMWENFSHVAVDIGNANQVILYFMLASKLVWCMLL
nr:tetratricopeptide repeat protein 27 homolog isoform X1 [Ipomoea batatas]GMD43281.1 tetratricopeptide repeat protein 27 homolog isoform X1 [Ipomoea batatas]